MRNASDKSCRANQNTHFVFCNFLQKIVPFVRLCGKNGRAGQATDGSTIWHMLFVCWISMDTNTHPDYVIRIPLHVTQNRTPLSVTQFVSLVPNTRTFLPPTFHCYISDSPSEGEASDSCSCTMCFCCDSQLLCT